MLIAVNGIVKHVGATPPQSVTIPSKNAAMTAWEQLKKRIKQDETVDILNRYLLTR